MKVEHIVKGLNNIEIRLILCKFLNCTPFHSFSINSTIFGSFIVDLNFSESFPIYIFYVKNKCFMIRINSDKTVIMKLTHSFF